jgi:flagellar biosynthetic protein FliR
LVVNIAFGVMSRAAPTLNLFAIGFPTTMLLGFLVLLFNIAAS